MDVVEAFILEEVEPEEHSHSRQSAWTGAPSVRADMDVVEAFILEEVELEEHSHSRPSGTEDSEEHGLDHADSLQPLREFSAVAHSRNQMFEEAVLMELRFLRQVLVIQGDDIKKISDRLTVDPGETRHVAATQSVQGRTNTAPTFFGKSVQKKNTGSPGRGRLPSKAGLWHLDQALQSRLVSKGRRGDSSGRGEELQLPGQVPSVGLLQRAAPGFDSVSPILGQAQGGGSQKPKRAPGCHALQGAEVAPAGDHQLEAKARPALPDTLLRGSSLDSLSPLTPVERQGSPRKGPHRAASVMFSPPVSMEEVRRRVQEDIVTKTRPVEQQPLSLADIPEGETACQPELYPGILERITTPVVQFMNMISFHALQLGGILPWSPSYYWASLSYQVGAFLLHFVILLATMEQAIDSSRDVIFYSDLAVSVGASVGLLAMLSSRAQLVECVQSLKDVAEQHDLVALVAITSGTDFLYSFAAWLLLVCARLSLLFLLPNDEPPAWEELLCLAGSIISSGELLLLATALLRISTYLTSMVDNFCSRFWAERQYSSALEEWNVLQATVRMSCSSVERSYVVLQSTVMLGVVVVVWEFLQRDFHQMPPLLLFIVFAAISQVFFRAAAVTEACARVPQLVNSTSWNNIPMDPERKYLVDYITASNAGFYTFNMRLSMSLVIRFMHYTGLVAATVARLVIGK